MAIRYRARFEIVSVPEGQAPLKIREAWVGVLLTGFFGPEIQQTMRPGGVLNRELVESYEGVAVAQPHALQELEKYSPSAALWWQKNGYPTNPMHLFVFNKNECRMISEPEEVPDHPFNTLIMWDELDFPHGPHGDMFLPRDSD